MLIVLIVAVIAVPVSAGKKPAGVYVTSAKIEVLSGDLERYEVAIALLDTLFHYHGPHAQGLFLMSQIMVDLIEKTADLDQKRGYVEKMVAYADSLHMCCENKEIKKKFRDEDDCNEYIEKSDSTLVNYWRTFFNDGVKQVNSISTTAEDLKNETDSTAQRYFRRQLEALIDSCLSNMSLAIMVDPTDSRPYSGLSSAYSAKGEFEKSNDYLVLALERADDRVPLLLSVAYNYIQLNSYCEAIPYLQEYIDGSQVTPENQDQILSTMYNLTICLNNCKEYDRAYGIFHRMHEIAPEDVRAMVGIGRYHNEMARNASDSASHYRGLEDEATTALWNDRRSQRFDSSKFYLGRAYDLQPDDKETALEYGVVCYVVGHFEDAARAFKKISELDPDDTDNWMSLGDCYLSIQQFTDATVAYEKVIESDPDNKEILERLSALYLETGQKDKRKQVDQKLESL